MRATWAILPLLLLGSGLTGCLGQDDEVADDDGTEGDGPPSSPPPSSPPTTTPSPPTTPPPAPPAPPPTPPAPFDMTGTGCREMIVQFPIPTERARLLVPANYTIATEPAGNVLAFGGLKVCDDVTMYGVSIGAASTSDVGITIESPDGSDGLHYYQVWWLTDNPILAAVLSGMGWRAAAVPTGYNDARVEGVAGTLDLTVDWPEGPYTASATSVAGPVFPDFLATGWWDGPHGTVAVRKAFVFSQAGSGPGTVAASSGPMADLLGGAEGNGAAIVMAYAMTGRVEYVDG